MTEKLKLAFYWAASCGGCEVAVLDINEKILDVVKVADILFWPVAIDTKYKDVEKLPDKHIDVCFFNGGIRNSEQEEIAKLLRKKSKTMVAFGACACLGGIPGLANQYHKEEIFNTAYIEAPTVENKERVKPSVYSKVSEGDLKLPKFYDRLLCLDDVVEVDYYLPGCPPTAEWVWRAVEAIVKGELPEKGSVIGLDKSLCDECPKEKSQEKKVKKFYRPYEIIPDPKKCLLEQGIICCGPATRAGCKAACPSVNMPCRGCYGPAPNVYDQGAKMLSAISSIIDSDDENEIEKIILDIGDPLGLFYQFSLSKSFLRGKVKSTIQVEEYKGPDRRVFPRTSTNFLVIYRIIETKEKDITLTRNVSLGGICLTTNRGFKEGTLIGIEIKMPFLVQPILMVGKVVNVEEIVKDVIYDTHIEFVELPEEHKQLLQQLI